MQKFKWLLWSSKLRLTDIKDFFPWQKSLIWEYRLIPSTLRRRWLNPTQELNATLQRSSSNNNNNGNVAFFLSNWFFFFHFSWADAKMLDVATQWACAQHRPLYHNYRNTPPLRTRGGSACTRSGGRSQGALLFQHTLQGKAGTDRFDGRLWSPFMVAELELTEVSLATKVFPEQFLNKTDGFDAAGSARTFIRRVTPPSLEESTRFPFLGFASSGSGRRGRPE